MQVKRDLNAIELKKVNGGNNISGTMINALIKTITTFFEMGKYLGSGLRRVMMNKTCNPT